EVAISALGDRAMVSLVGGLGDSWHETRVARGGPRSAEPGDVSELGDQRESRLRPQLRELLGEGGDLRMLGFDLDTLLEVRDPRLHARQLLDELEEAEAQSLRQSAHLSERLDRAFRVEMAQRLRDTVGAQDAPDVVDEHLADLHQRSPRPEDPSHSILF